LEEIEVALVDQRDPNRLARKGMADFQTRKTATYHHHVGPGPHHLFRRLKLEKKPFHGLATPAGKQIYGLAGPGWVTVLTFRVLGSTQRMDP
jgi:hypothetical protein